MATNDGIHLALFANDLRVSLANNSPERTAYVQVQRHYNWISSSPEVHSAHLMFHLEGDKYTIPAKLRQLRDDFDQAARDFERLHPSEPMLLELAPDADSSDVDTLPSENDQEWFDDRTGYLDYLAEQFEVADRLWEADAAADYEDGLGFEFELEDDHEWPRREAFTGRTLEPKMDTRTFCILCRQRINRYHAGCPAPLDPAPLDVTKGERVLSEGYITPNNRLVLDK